MNLYVSNLSFHTSEEDLKTMFSKHGDVKSVKVIIDKVTGRSRGFGFIEMTNDEEAQKAISMLNNKDIEGRALVVTVAREREDRGYSPKKSW